MTAQISSMDLSSICFAPDLSGENIEVKMDKDGDSIIKEPVLTQISVQSSLSAFNSNSAQEALVVPNIRARTPSEKVRMNKEGSSTTAAVLIQPSTPSSSSSRKVNVQTLEKARSTKIQYESEGLRSRMRKCCACDDFNDAEYIHPKLSVPICGTCNKSVKDARYEVDPESGNHWECVMCGVGDGNWMFMCDKCDQSFCDLCMVRTVGQKEADRVRALKVWDCYSCSPTKVFASLQVPPNHQFFNVESVYQSIKPPISKEKHASIVDVYCPKQLYDAMSTSERSFASMFSSSMGAGVITNTRICDTYLTAVDLPVLRCLSKKLNAFFDRVLFTPGLFKTDYGDNHACMLYPHQITSLRWMTHAESRNTDFGSLRGGILADAPGLGKTVTVISLVLSTAGAVPKEPRSLMLQNDLETEWAQRTSQANFDMIEKAVIKTVKQSEFKVFPYLLSSACISGWFERGECHTLRTFESKVRSAIRYLTAHNPRHGEVLRHSFRMNMLLVKETTGKHNRAFVNSEEGARLLLERSLYPSAATLIIVPMSLLEHWFEQLSRHVDLNYLVHQHGAGTSSVNEDGHWDRDVASGRRGVIYFDGLGDILDIQAPLPKLRINEDRRSGLELSQYLIVVTTFERCASLQQKVKATKSKTSARDRRYLLSGASNEIGRDGIEINKIRWLRLIVDEGHELGGRNIKTGDVSPATEFIRELAAERRWVMSGTPTTGTTSSNALSQIQRLLVFLRHPKYGTGQNGLKLWKKIVSGPFLMQAPEARQTLQELLAATMVRHTKEDLQLFEPIKEQVVLDTAQLQVTQAKALAQLDSLAQGDVLTDNDNIIDKLKAQYIYNIISSAKAEWQRNRKMDATRHSLGTGSGQGTPKGYIRIGNEESGHQAQSNVPNRRPKCSIFSTDGDHLNGVGHFLYLWMGERSICEHGGIHRDATASKFMAESRSSELSRFRCSMRKYRRCPLCGCENSITSGPTCLRTLLLVEYDEEELHAHQENAMSTQGLPSVAQLQAQTQESSWFTKAQSNVAAAVSSVFADAGYHGDHQAPTVEAGFSYTTSGSSLSAEVRNQVDSSSSSDVADDNPPHGPPPAQGGHGFAGRGGFFTGQCLCSPQGCEKIHTDTKSPCLPNPFYCDTLRGLFRDREVNSYRGNNQGRNLALVAEEHVRGWVPGHRWFSGERVYVNPSIPDDNTDEPPSASTASSRQESSDHAPLHVSPVLWRGGRMGGHARVRAWKKCGSGSGQNGWHRGHHILESSPWIVEDEDASVLLLQEDGSTGLDLSFATHLFLLDTVRDPALESQIISRAHRMGAKGPVHITLLLANQTREDAEKEAAELAAKGMYGGSSSMAGP